MILPDTSIWIDYSRRGSEGRAAVLGELLDAGEVATCGPVVAEILAGAEGEVEERMWMTLSSLPWAELDSESWRLAGTTARELRAAGQTVALTDLVIAVASSRGSHALWSLDVDFERIRSVLPALELYTPA